MEAPLAATSFHSGAFEPRDNHRTSFREDIFKDGGSRHEPVLPLTPVAGLALLRRLSLDIREFEPDDSNQSKPPSASILAALYCQRAATLLEYADYDAAITLPAHVMSATVRTETSQQQQQQQQPEDSANGNDSHLLVHAVSQALEDSAKASSLEPAAPEGYILAAQCARSTGDLSEASKMIRLAVDKAPPDTEIAQLAKEIALETSQVTHDKPSSFPALTTSTEAIRFAEMSNGPNEHATNERLHHGRSTDHSDNNDSDEAGTSHESWHRIVSEFEALKAVSESQHLVKMEQMMHHNVHHRCADQEQVSRLDEALKTVMSFLVLFVKCRHCLNVNVIDADEFEAIVKTKLERGDWHHSLIQNRTARKWMVEKLVTATRVSSHLISEVDSSVDIPRVGVGFLRDALVLLARVLLSTGCWRLCTSMPHAMAYAEMSYDLVKELSASNSGSPPSSSSSLSSVPGFAQLEMACSDAYGVALREMLGDHNEALSLHQESLETAVLLKSHAYELRCHHHIGQTLLHMKEPVLAQAEFMQLLVLSQAEGDAAMEALAQYELGQCCVQRGEFDEAQVHFRYAQTICNQTANCSGTWRPQSIQQAIAFYAVLRPARRRDAMRYMAPAAGVRDRPRRAGVLYNESTLTSKGEVEPQDDQTDPEKQPTASAIAKLFRASMGLSGVGDSMMASSTDSAGGAARKSRRRAGRRESVLAVPHSRAQLSRLASPVSSSSQFSCSPSVSPLSSCSTPSNEPSSVYGQHSNSSGTSSCGSLGTVLSYTGKLAMPADVVGERGGHDTPVQAGSGTYQASL